jgi:glycyl-tRNA synthetase
MNRSDFFDPEGTNTHRRFPEVANVKINLLDRHQQLSGNANATPVNLGEAVKTGAVPSETIGYFLGRIQLFLTRIGLDPNKIRFREHMDNEMGKYHWLSQAWFLLTALKHTTQSSAPTPSY